MTDERQEDEEKSFKVKSYPVCMAQTCDGLTFIFRWYSLFIKFWWLFQLHTMHLVTVVFPVVCICYLDMSVQTEYSTFLQSACGM